MSLRPQCPPEPTRAEQARESRVESAWDDIASDSEYMAEAMHEHRDALSRAQLELICSLAVSADRTLAQSIALDDIYWALAEVVAGAVDGE